MRLFIAADLPEDIRGALEDNIGDLKEVAKGERFTSANNLHITLAFLGEQDEASIETIRKCMTTVAEDVESFEIALADYGFFGSENKKTLWQGFEDATELVGLASRLRDELENARISFDAKEFRPHITLARKSSIDLERVEEPWVGEGEVESMTLYRSELRPEGPIYTALQTARLRTPYEHPASRIAIIDADACPVTKEAVDEARRAGVPMVLVGNGTQNLAKHLKKGDLLKKERGFWATTINVLGGDDSADFKIATIVKEGDVVVTQDIGVAAMALGAGAKAIGVRGREYTKATIDAALLIRHEEKKVRRQGGRTQGPNAFTAEDRDRFRNAFRRLLTNK